jgi:hypothetical protein
LTNQNNRNTDPTGETCNCPENNGSSDGQQTFIGNAALFIKNNWGIKDWSNRNLNIKNISNSVSDGLKSAGDFITRNLESLANDIANFLGLGGSSKPKQQPVTYQFQMNGPMPNTFGQSLDGYYGGGFSNNGYVENSKLSKEIIMKTIRNTPYLNQQYNRILKAHPTYYIDYVDVMLRSEEAISFRFREKLNQKERSYTNFYRPFTDLKGNRETNLKYLILHEFGHIWSSISGQRIKNFNKYGEESSIPGWIDEIYADRYAQYWGGFPLSSQSYELNSSNLKTAGIKFNFLFKY